MDWTAIAREFGVPITMLIVIIYTGQRGVWTWARELHQERAERAKAEARAERWEKIAWEAVTTAKVATEKGGS